MASNVGSAATITGNPQNIMIGSVSHIPYTTFAATLGPVSLAGLLVTLTLIVLFHRDEFTGTLRAAPKPKAEANRVLVMRALLTTLILIALFFAGIGPAKAAIALDQKRPNFSAFLGRIHISVQPYRPPLPSTPGTIRLILDSDAAKAAKKGTESVPYGPIPHASEQGIFCRLTGN